MRFLHVNHRYFPYVGGSERYMQEISEALASSGHDVSVVTSDAHDLEYFWDGRRARIDAPSSERINDVDVRRVPVRHFPASPFIFQGSRRALGELSGVPVPSAVFDLVSTRLPWMPDLNQALANAGPSDLVHAANLGLEGLALHAQRHARKLDVPLVITPFAHLGRSNDPVARRYVSMPHQRELLNGAQSIVVMTLIEATFIIALGIDAGIVHVAGVGIDPVEVSGGDAVRFRNRYCVSGALVGTAGAVAFEKGARESVLAVRELRRRGHDISLVLAGPRLANFDTWFGSLPETDREGIIVPGFVDSDEKRDMLAAIDVLVMPSRTESFGISYLEGWANGKPVIAARAGAVPEIVQDGVNGMLVEFGDVRAIRDAILDLLSDATMARALGEAGHGMTMQRFTWPKVLSRVGQAYSHALGYTVGLGDDVE